MQNPTHSPQRYWFFISYSHADRGEAARVQRGIEGFRIPEALRGKSGRFGELPKRPVPVFRDRDALASSHDLTAEIQGALAASANLLVACSRAAAQSQWVAREVEAFIQLHGREAVLCLVVDGEPNAAGRMPEGKPCSKSSPPASGFPTGAAPPEAWRLGWRRRCSWRPGLACLLSRPT